MKKFLNLNWMVVILGLLLIKFYFISIMAFSYGDLIPSQLGPLGDFIAGFANPIISFLGFVAVVLTLHNQNIESKRRSDDSDKNAELQREAIRVQLSMAKVAALTEIARNRLQRAGEEKVKHNDIASAARAGQEVDKDGFGSYFLKHSIMLKSEAAYFYSKAEEELVVLGVASSPFADSIRTLHANLNERLKPNI